MAIYYITPIFCCMICFGMKFIGIPFENWLIVSLCPTLLGINVASRVLEFLSDQRVTNIVRNFN